ncbi:hypothetical protein [Escherichia phage IMM-001]|nr:hypothetical protein [Escherichia phage IMM-001]
MTSLPLLFSNLCYLHRSLYQKLLKLRCYHRRTQTCRRIYRESKLNPQQTPDSSEKARVKHFSYPPALSIDSLARSIALTLRQS